MQTISNVLKWIFVSSADAGKWSLTVKMALLGAVPAVMQGIGLACGFHVVCVAVNADQLTTIALSVANLVYLGLSAVASIGVLYGVIRKISLTATGNNAAFPPNALG